MYTGGAGGVQPVIKTNAATTQKSMPIAPKTRIFIRISPLRDPQKCNFHIL
jgi:hypothetical protein